MASKVAARILVRSISAHLADTDGCSYCLDSVVAYLALRGVEQFGVTNIREVYAIG
jgi:hypothetical protein